MANVKKILVVTDDGKIKTFEKGVFITLQYDKQIEDVAKLSYYFCNNNSENDEDNLCAVLEN